MCSAHRVAYDFLLETIKSEDVSSCINPTTPPDIVVGKLDMINLHPTPSNFVEWNNQSKSVYFPHMVL